MPVVEPCEGCGKNIDLDRDAWVCEMCFSSFCDDCVSAWWSDAIFPDPLPIALHACG